MGLDVKNDSGFYALIKKEISLYNNLIVHIKENLNETLAAIDGI